MLLGPTARNSTFQLVCSNDAHGLNFRLGLRVGTLRRFRYPWDLRFDTPGISEGTTQNRYHGTRNTCHARKWHDTIGAPILWRWGMACRGLHTNSALGLQARWSPDNARTSLVVSALYALNILDYSTLVDSVFTLSYSVLFWRLATKMLTSG